MKWEMYNEQDILFAIWGGVRNAQTFEVGTSNKLKCREKVYSNFPAYAGFLWYEI